MKIFQTNATVFELVHYAHTPPEFQNKGAPGAMVLYDRKYERPSVITGRCENKSSPTKIHNEKHIERETCCAL